MAKEREKLGEVWILIVKFIWRKKILDTNWYLFNIIPPSLFES